MISGMIEALTASDHKRMRRIHRRAAPRWIRIRMLCATRGGEGWIWYVMGAVILALGGTQRLLSVGTAWLAAAAGWPCSCL